MVQVVQPKIGERIYDGPAARPASCARPSTFSKRKRGLTTRDLRTLQERTFYGKEKKSLAYVIAIMNMILHGIDAPNILHTQHPGREPGDIQDKDRVDVVLANPPFGGKSARKCSRTFPPHRRDRVPVPATLHPHAQGPWPRCVVIKNTFLSNTDNDPSACRKAPAGKLQPAHRPRLPRRHLPGRRREDRRALLRQRLRHAQTWFYQLDPGRKPGQAQSP